MSMYSAESGRGLETVDFIFFAKLGGHGSVKIINNSDWDCQTLKAQYGFKQYGSVKMK